MIFLWMRIVFMVLCGLQGIYAADVCLVPTPHKDVNSNTVPAIVEKAPDQQQCVNRCATLKDTLPCRSAVFVETKARNSRALCKMYSRSAKQTGSLVDVTDQSFNDATYFDIVDQCTADSQRVSVDTAAPAPAPAPAPGPIDPGMSTTMATMTTSLNPPGGMIIVQPGPGGSIPGPAGPGPDPPPPVPVDPTTTTMAPAPQVPPGGGGGGPFVPGPNGGNGGIIPAPQGGNGVDGGQGGNGAFVPGPNGPSAPIGGGGVYPQPAGGYTPPPQYSGGGYDAWSPWGACTVSCGGGVMYRVRACGSGACQGQGPDKELKTCMARKACSNWGPWTEWTPCSCSGQKTRSRQCQGGYGCSGESTDKQSCSSYGSSCGYNPQPQPVYQPVYVPRPPPPPPQPHSYYDAIHNQYYRNRG